MGQLFRSAMSNDNIIGNYCKDIVNSGQLVPHFVSYGRYDIALQIVTAKKVGLMVDGFPRSMPQSEFVEKEMEKYGRDFIIVHFELSKEKAIERMLKRAEIEGRKDDNIEAMTTRINTFMEETLPSIKSLESKGKVVTVDADGTIEEVNARLKENLGL